VVLKESKNMLKLILSLCAKLFFSCLLCSVLSKMSLLPASCEEEKKLHLFHWFEVVGCLKSFKWWIIYDLIIKDTVHHNCVLLSEQTGTL